MSRAVPRFKRTNPSASPVGTTNGILMYRIAGVLEGQLTINTFTYQAAVPLPTALQLSTFLTNVSTAVFGPYKGCLSADWSATSEQVVVIHRNDLVGATSVANLGAVGGRPAGHEPTEVAIPLIRTSALKGQHGRGRVSLPAVSTTDVLGSKLTGAPINTAINALIAGMKASVSDGSNTWLPCIVQRSGSPPRLAIGYTALQTVTSSGILGTIRRRKLGRGK